MRKSGKSVFWLNSDPRGAEGASMRTPAALVLILSLGAAPSPAADVVHELKGPRADVPDEDVFLTLGTALLASSFAFQGCVKPYRHSKLPLIAFSGGAGVFLVREAFIKERFKERSEELLSIEDWEESVEDARKQVEAKRRAAKLELAAAEAAGKKAGNARILKHTLLLSAGALAAFLVAKCASAAGPLTFECVRTHNSCKEPEQETTINTENPPRATETTPEAADMRAPAAPPETPTTPEPPTYYLDHCDDVDYACQGHMTPPELSPGSQPAIMAQALQGLASLLLPSPALAANAKKIGLASVAALAGLKLGGKIASAPDFYKAILLTGLGVSVHRAANKWREAEKTFKKRAGVYEDLADRIERTLASRGRKNPDTRRDLVATRARGHAIPKSRNPGDGPCATGAMGSLTMDPDCSCRKDNSCARMDLPAWDARALDFMPPFVGEAYGDLVQAGDSVLAGRGASLGSLDGGAGGFGRHAADLRKWRDGLFDKIRKASPRAFDDRREKARKWLRGSVLKAWRGMKPAARDSFMWGPAPKVPGAALGGSGRARGASGPGTLRLGAASPGGDGKSPGSAGTAGGRPAAAPAEPPWALDVVGDEVSGHRPGTSLWDIITRRYFKSTFPVLFGERPGPRKGP